MPTRAGWKPALPCPEARMLRGFVLEMPLAFHRLGVLILTQDVFIQLHVGSAEIFEPCFDPLFTLHHFFGEIICIDVDANRADNAEVLSQNRNGSALEPARANLELVVQLVLVLELTLL